jgi:hypothetical protein
MWVFLNNAFMSIVQHRAQPRKVMIRARFRGDLETVFPDLADQVQETPTADYRFRLTVSKARLQKALSYQVARIDYDNFKGSVAEQWRHDAYMGVWGVMWREQKARSMPQVDDRTLPIEFDDFTDD